MAFAHFLVDFLLGLQPHVFIGTFLCICILSEESGLLGLVCPGHILCRLLGLGSPEAIPASYIFPGVGYNHIAAAPLHTSVRASTGPTCCICRLGPGTGQPSMLSEISDWRAEAQPRLLLLN